MEQTQNMEKFTKDQINVDTTIQLCYVVLSNTIKVDPKTHKRDDFTRVLWVFETEEDAEAYRVQIRAKTPSMLTSFYVIPTPFGRAKVHEKTAQN